jgi:hypothetical protein
MMRENKGENSSPLKPEWISAIKKYTTGTSKDLSRALFRGEVLSSELADIDKSLEEFFEQSGRAMRYESLCYACNHTYNPGDEFTLPAWISSSTNWYGTKIFGEKLYLIVGAIGADVRDLSGADQRYHQEYEIIVKKGQRFRAGEPVQRKILDYDDYTGEDDVITISYIPLYCITE